MVYKFKITPIFNAEVRDGRLVLPEEEYHRYRLFCLSQGGPTQFILRKKFKLRSLPLNAYFHGVVVPMIAEAIGEEASVTKALLKAKFLTKEIAVKGKEDQLETVRIVGRTSKLSSANFSLFVEKCRVFASSFLGVNIPDPDKSHNEHPIMIDED